MGILNCTPDSFSDGGDYADVERAVARGVELAEEGADILDIGGESTRPGAEPVSVEEELQRVVPVIQELSNRIDVPISIDTTKAAVARAAIEAGAEVINDISALRFDPEMIEVAASFSVPVVLMHMQGTPRTMQQHIQYGDIMNDIEAFFEERIAAAIAGGIAQDRIIVDPGIGFGKSIDHDNFAIINRLKELQRHGRPVLVGPSRKAFIGKLLDKEVTAREEGTAAAVALSVYNGAHIVRVHTVHAMCMVMRVADAVLREQRAAGD